jgi:methyl-accepting chemotaxis protein
MKNWSLNAKVFFIVGIFTAAAVAIAVMGINKLAYVNGLLVNITNVEVKRDQLTADIQDQERQVTIISKDIIIEKDPARMEKMIQEIKPARERLLSLIDKYKGIANDKGRDLADKYRAAIEEWEGVNAEVRKLTRDGKDAEARDLVKSRETPLRLKASAVMQEMNDITAKDLDDETVAAKSSYEAARDMMLVISIAAILAGGLLAFFVMRAMSKAIDHVISSLDDNSNQVTGAAQQIAASSEQLSQAATEQASSLEETASSIEEMNSMVQKNSENARKSSDVSVASQDSATKGKKVVREMIEAIDGINASNKEIAEIVKVIGEIGNKTKVINDIVFQTKLLSFNASVEAARAGEHGKGFAVVAEEVGNLAQMSGNAAKEISTLLEESIQKVERIVSETSGKVESGTQIARQCGDVLEEIVGNVSSVAQMVGEIATACQEQAQGVQEITRAMNQLDQVTQENASTSEECASTAEELSAQAESLRGVVQVLIETVKGAKGGKHEAATPAPASAAHAEKAKVVPIKKAAAGKRFRASSGDEPLRLAAGAEGAVPSENDPRFKEV